MSNDKAQSIRQCVDIYYSHPGKNLAETLLKIACAANERIDALTKSLKVYADASNWNEDAKGIKRVWLEPESSTPAAYNGFENARATLRAIPSGASQ